MRAVTNTWVPVPGVELPYRAEGGQRVRIQVTATVRAARAGGGLANCMLFLGWAANFPQRELFIETPADGSLSGDRHVTFIQNHSALFDTGEVPLKLQVGRATDTAAGECEVRDAVLEVAVH